MNFYCKFIAIPEIDFTDYGDVMELVTIEAQYPNKILRDMELRIIFNVGPKDLYDKFTNGMIEKSNQISEILVFLDNYETIVDYKECILTNLDIKLSGEPSFRTLSGHGLGGGDIIQNYIMDATFKCKTSQKMETKLFDRHKKLGSIIKKIKKDGTK